jgi:hypothetical protein
MQMFLRAKHLAGDAIELGVARGDTTFPLANLMLEFTPDKKLYACDTFSGLPYDDVIVSEYMCRKGEMNWGNLFYDLLAIRKDQNIVPIAGLIENTLIPCLRDNKFCFAWVDMDLYQPTSFAYKFLEDRMVIGGIIGFHDYKFVRCPGVQQVVDTEVNKEKYRIIHDEYTCIYLQRVQ